MCSAQYMVRRILIRVYIDDKTAAINRFEPAGIKVKIFL